MKITTVRRISQVFFFVLFIWLCVVSTLGDSFWQLRGWPVNIFLQLDPLTAVATSLSTHRLYAGLLWAVPVIMLTFIVGRFFCGWLCPFGALHQFTGYIMHGKKPVSEKIRLNGYRKMYNIKYYILVVFLAMAAFPSGTGSLVTGLLDPLPFFTRTVNLVLIPVMDMQFHITSKSPRYHEGGLVILALFLLMVVLNAVVPRFFCRVICPAGALMAIMARVSPWKISRNGNACTECGLCSRSCEGGCEPSGAIRQAECVLCFNCIHDCHHGTMSYQTAPSSAGEVRGPEMSRKSFIATLGAGVLSVPAIRIAGTAGHNWDHDLVRPPGAAGEEEFLTRCVKCGQCMRLCPTNIIQPAGLEHGLEEIWTPKLDFRIGTSGCQYNCVACGQICPTAAIRPITLDEKQGRGDYKKKGPVRIGTAFFDRSRCLPWAMNTPCIVCQENCPVSPKAIYTDEVYEPVWDGILEVRKVLKRGIELKSTALKEGMYASGDYFLQLGERRYRIRGNGIGDITTVGDITGAQTGTALVVVHLQRPILDPGKCIGCGICEHECPVQGLKAVKISAEGETRSPRKKMMQRKN